MKNLTIAVMMLLLAATASAQSAPITAQPVPQSQRTVVASAVVPEDGLYLVVSNLRLDGGFMGYVWVEVEATDTDGTTTPICASVAAFIPTIEPVDPSWQFSTAASCSNIILLKDGSTVSVAAFHDYGGYSVITNAQRSNLIMLNLTVPRVATAMPVVPIVVERVKP